MIVKLEALELVRETLVNDLDGVREVVEIPLIIFRVAEEEPTLGFQQRGLGMVGENLLANVAQSFQLIAGNVAGLAVVHTILAVLNEPRVNGIGLAPIADVKGDFHRG